MLAATLALSLAMTWRCTRDDNTQADVRFRVSVEIVEGGIIRRGSSVWAMKRELRFFGFGESFEYVAEAVPIRLGDGSWFFFLPTNKDYSGGGASWPEQLFKTHGGGSLQRLISNLRALSRQTGRSERYTCASDPSDRRVLNGVPVCPTLLRAANPADPQSYRVIPWLEGPQKSPQPVIRSVVATITDQPASWRLSRICTWLRDADRLAATDRNALGQLEISELPEGVRYIRVPFVRFGKL